MAVLREDIVSLRFEVQNDPVALMGREMRQLVAGAGTAADKLSGAFGRCVDSLRGAGGQLDFGLPKLNVDSFRTELGAAQGALLDAKSGFAAGFAEMGGQAEIFRQRVNGMGTGVVARLRQMGGEMHSTLGNIRLEGVGSHIMQGLLSGILSQRAAILGAAQGIADGIRSTIQQAMRIASPSKEMAELGRYIGLGLPVGMQAALPNVESGARQLADAARPEVNAGQNAIPASGRMQEVTVAPVAAAGRGAVVNHYSPSFHLEVHGGQAQNEFEMERKVKTWVRQALEKTISAAQTAAGREV